MNKGSHFSVSATTGLGIAPHMPISFVSTLDIANIQIQLWGGAPDLRVPGEEGR